MSAIRRFMVMEGENNIFKFTIDTRNIVVGATNGAENPLTFRLPLNYPTNADHQFIIRVNDGRPDVAFDRTVAGSIIHFATAGIYQITLIGRSRFFLTWAWADNLKWIYLDVWGSTFRGLHTSAFQGMTNLVIRSHEPIKLTGGRGAFFAGIKGFAPDFEMYKIDVSEVSNFTGFFSGVQLPMYSVLNPFINVATTMSQIYDGVDLSNVPKIEIISPTLTILTYAFRNTDFSGEIIIRAPITLYYGTFNGVLHSLNLGKIDVRVATNFIGGWIGKTLTTEHMDATLLGWVNNFDWSATPVIARTVNFYGSKHSNNPAVIAAKNFLQSQGFTFQNLTME